MIPLPCPFCGSTEVHIQTTSTYRWVAVHCNSCGAVGPEIRRVSVWSDELSEVDRGYATEEWNRRMP